MLTTTRPTLMSRPASVVLCGVLLLAGIGSAHADPPQKVVFTKNLDERGRAPYQTTQLVITSACSFNGILYFCNHSLPAVPDGKRLVIERLTVFAALASGSPDSVRFMDPVSFGTLYWLQPNFTPRAVITSHFFLNQEVLVFYESTQQPLLRFQFGGQPQSVEFTVHGYLIDATN